MNERDLKKIFETHKIDVPDEGFSERIVRQLPERRSILPQIVMIVFIMIGLVSMFALQGFTPLLDQINSLITSISRMQAPSPIAIIFYIGFLSMVGIIGYAVVKADADN